MIETQTWLASDKLNELPRDQLVSKILFFWLFLAPHLLDQVSEFCQMICIYSEFFSKWLARVA